VLIDVPNIDVKCPDVVINDGKNGGLVKVKELVQKVNALEQDINTLKNAFKAWVVTPQDGGAKLYAAATTWANTPLQQTKVKDIENDKVKH